MHDIENTTNCYYYVTIDFPYCFQIDAKETTSVH